MSFRFRPLHRVTSAIAKDLSSARDDPSIAHWRPRSVAHGECNIAVVFAAPPGGVDPAAAIKMARSREGVAVLEREAVSLEALGEDPRIGPWARHAPSVLGKGVCAGWTYVAEEALVGVAPAGLGRDPMHPDPFLDKAARLIEELHRRTASILTVGESTIEDWVDRRLRLLAPLGCDPLALDRVGGELRAALQGRPLPAGWIHGDYWPGNLITADGAELAGIVDWDRAAPREPALHDLFHLLIYARRLSGGRELGHAVCDLLTGEAPWTEAERSILGRLPFPGGEEDERAALILYWLRHLESNLLQSQSYARHRRWIGKNVRAVLACIVRV